MDFIKHLYSAKDTFKRMKRQADWKKIFAEYISDGLLFKIYKELLKLNR